MWYHFFAVIATLFATRGTINKIRHRKMPSKTPEMIGKRTEDRVWENIVKSGNKQKVDMRARKPLKTLTF